MTTKATTRDGQKIMALHCDGCGKNLGAVYYPVKDRVLCSDCSRQVEREDEE